MTKRDSEGKLGAALREMDLAVVVVKLTDDARNWKPADYLAWYRDYDHALSHWFEAKDTDAVNAFPRSELRPSQMLGIREAERVGVDYWLAIYWRKHRTWTISDAVKVLRWFAEAGTADPPVKSITRELLMSRFGIQSSPGQLSSTLKSVVLGEVD